MSIINAVRAQIDDETKQFEVKTPNLATQKAIEELAAGKGKEFKNITALMNDLNADD